MNLPSGFESLFKRMDGAGWLVSGTTVDGLAIPASVTIKPTPKGQVQLATLGKIIGELDSQNNTAIMPNLTPEEFLILLAWARTYANRVPGSGQDPEPPLRR